MQDQLKAFITKVTGAIDVHETEKIQTLWSGYGEIVRISLEESPIKTIILKNIHPPVHNDHPRGWNTNFSHQRKLRSYEVEKLWYQKWSSRCNDKCRVPKCYAITTLNGAELILLEDLDLVGFPIRKSSLNKEEVKRCIAWLANFHATFIDEKPVGLWEKGTYWHLTTRPDELNAMKNSPLKLAAHQIDELLNNCQYQTIVHGDAKVANFCFSENSKEVAAVDFQYVGGGCGMKDIVYLLGSCLDESSCELMEKELLDYYFLELKEALLIQGKEMDQISLEKEWRKMYAIAWTDFSRFLMGWMPSHHKINSYSKKLEQKVLDIIV